MLKKETRFKIAFAFTLLVVSALMLEFLAYINFDANERAVPASKIISLQHNIYAENVAQRTSCFFVQTTIGHPFLGYVYRRADVQAKNCHGYANNIGMESALDLPLIKNENEYAIMVMGGSVAHLMSTYKLEDGHNYLSTVLNKLYYPPNGKSVFRVYTGAVGGWAMPTPIMMLSMYNERIDAAIVLDGYNESFPVAAGVRFEHLPVEQAVLANMSASSFSFKVLNGLWSYRRFILESFLKHSYFFNMSYKIALGMSKNFVVDDIAERDFSIGNTERIELPPEQAKEWTLKSLEGYIKKFHLFAGALNIKTAHFLQPTRIYGKVLTPDEAAQQEFIPEETYRKVHNLYRKLASEKLPVFDLTNIFINEKERIYSDHIHYIHQNNYSKGNEILVEEIARKLGAVWGLKKRN